MPDRSDPSLSPSDFWPRPGSNKPLEQDIHCPDCGYNLRGLSSGTCPECGKSVEHHVKVDHHFMSKPALPWMHRRGESRFTAFYSTAMIVCFKPMRLAEQLWERGHLSRSDARRFAMFVALHAGVVLLPAVVASVLLPGPGDPRRQFLALLSAVLTAGWIWRAVTATPRFVAKLTMAKDQLRRAEILSHYSWSPLVLAPALVPAGLVIWHGWQLSTTNPALSDAIMLAGMVFAGLLVIYFTIWPMVFLYLILAAKPLELLVLYISTLFVRSIELAAVAVLLSILWGMLS